MSGARLTRAQTEFLLRPIRPARVQHLDGMSHLEVWDVRRHLIRVFGVEGFSIETLSLDLVSERESRGQRPRWTVVYRAQVRLTVRTPGGEVASSWEDAAAGDAVNQPRLGDAHDFAMKGLALDTKIPTPTGWATMGDLQPGDTVFDKDGNPAPVIATSPVKHLDCYEVTFLNGHRSIVCDEEHLWVAKVAQEKEKVHNIASLYEAKKAGKPVVIPVAAPLVTDEDNLPIDPWVLGYWLGNGSRSKAHVTSHEDDTLEVISRITSAGYGVGALRAGTGKCTEIGITDGLWTELRELGLPEKKYVPAAYFRASVEQRRALLAGLLDSDGTVDRKCGRVIFNSTDKGLAEAVVELARSLGEPVTFTSTMNSGYGKTVRSYAVQWTPTDVIPFSLTRKASKTRLKIRRVHGHRVTSITKIDSVPTKCIAVDSPTHTFLAGEDMIPTHNTALSQALKRCAVNLGDQFGLSLYNGGSTSAVVIRSLAYADGPVTDDAPVQPEPTPAVPVAAPDVPVRDFVAEARESGDPDVVRQIWQEARAAGLPERELGWIASVGRTLTASAGPGDAAVAAAAAAPNSDASRHAVHDESDRGLPAAS